MNHHKSVNRLTIAWELSRYSSRRKVNGLVLGTFWSFLEPMLMFVILMLLRARLGNSDITHYPLYLFVGLFSYQFFAQATRRIMVCLKAYSRYAKTFPLHLDTYIFATYFETIKDCSFQLLIIAGLLLWSRLSLISMLPFAVAFFIFTLFVLGIGFFLAAQSVYFKDLEIIWGLICRVLFFATPIFYSIDFAPAIIKFNPLVSYLEVFRDLLINGRFSLTNWLWVVLLSVLFLVMGQVFFRLLQKRIVEAI